MDSMEIRRKQIVELVNQKEYVRFSEIKEHFPNVSEMTLRTDLKALDEEKKIVRIHGGAKSVQLVIGTDDYFNRRAVRNLQGNCKKGCEIDTARHGCFPGFRKHGDFPCTSFPQPV